MSIVYRWFDALQICREIINAAWTGLVFPECSMKEFRNMVPPFLLALGAGWDFTRSNNNSARNYDYHLCHLSGVRTDFHAVQRGRRDISSADTMASARTAQADAGFSSRWRSGNFLFQPDGAGELCHGLRRVRLDFLRDRSHQQCLGQRAHFLRRRAGRGASLFSVAVQRHLPKDRKVPAKAASRI